MKTLTILLLTATALLAQTPTPIPSPTPPPISPVIAGKWSISWDKSTATGVTSYKVYTSPTFTLDATGKFMIPVSFTVPAPTTTPVTYTFTGLADGTYFIAVTAVSPGGESKYSNFAAASVTTAVPPPPPTGLKIVSQSVVVNPNRKGAKVVWTTNLPSTGKVLYGTDKLNLSQIVNDPAPASVNHTARLDGKRGITYFYAVASTANNVTMLGDVKSFALR